MLSTMAMVHGSGSWLVHMVIETCNNFYARWNAINYRKGWGVRRRLTAACDVNSVYVCWAETTVSSAQQSGRSLTESTRVRPSPSAMWKPQAEVPRCSFLMSWIVFLLINLPRARFFLELTLGCRMRCCHWFELAIFRVRIATYFSCAIFCNMSPRVC